MRITTHTADPALEVGSDRYFQYDTMDRQIVVDAIDAQGNLGTVGHRLTYDVNGNRITDLSWGNHVTTNGGQTVITGYDDRGKARYVTTPITYTRSMGPSLEVYAYDGLNRLTSVVKDGIQIDHRYYDTANRLVQTGPEGNLPVGYAQKLNEGLPPEQVNGLESRLARFDANGRISRQLTLRSDNSLETNQLLTYDAVGNLTNDTRFHYTPSQVNDYTDAYTHNSSARETYKDRAVTRLHKQPPAADTQTDLIHAYDANGNLVGLDDTANNAYDRTLVNDLNGQLLFINQAGNVSRQFIVNGEVLGVYGVRPNAVNPTNAQGNPNFAALAEFSFGYQPIASRSLAPSPGNYTTQAGDTLRSIAQRAYGDARLWFRIAEVNSLQGDQDLRIGQTLTIPNVPAGTHNDQNTTNAPNTFDAIEDLTPALPMPQGQAGGGCGGMGAIVTAAIAIAVTVALTGPLILPAASAVGSAAGQVAGNALGIQDGFSWKQVALAAIAAQVGQSVQAQAAAASEVVSQGVSQAVSQGVSQTVAQSSGLSLAFEAARQAALTSTITQGIGVVTGLQSSFSWKGVVASAAGAGVSSALGPALINVIPGEEIGPQILRGALNATAAGATTALLQGGKLNTVQIATDAFGNALGRAFVQSPLASSSQPKIDVEAQFRASAYNVEAYSDNETSQDFAREQVRFDAARIGAESIASYSSNNGSTLSSSTQPKVLGTSRVGSSTSPLSVNPTNATAEGQRMATRSAADLQPDGVYVDDNGQRHFRVNIANGARLDPIAQFKAGIQDRLDQWGANAVARDDEFSVALGGIGTVLNEFFMPNSSWELAAGFAAGPLLGKGFALGVRGLEVAASRTAMTSWLAADLKKAPAAVSQSAKVVINATLSSGKGAIDDLQLRVADIAEDLMIKRGRMLRAVESSDVLTEGVQSAKKININEKPIGTVFKGTVYRLENSSRVSTAWDVHEWNIASDHRYSGPGYGAIYSSTSEKTAFAEVDHYGLAAGRVNVSKEINISNVLDLTNEETLRALNISNTQITQDSYLVTQKIGNWARNNGYDGIMAPSARHQGGSNLVVFPKEY